MCYLCEQDLCAAARLVWTLTDKPAVWWKPRTWKTKRRRRILETQAMRLAKASSVLHAGPVRLVLDLEANRN